MSAPRAEAGDVEAEKNVLAAMLLSKEAADEVPTMLEPGDFYRVAHGVIFEEMLALAAAGSPIDHITVADRLKSTGRLEVVGGRAYLLELADDTFSLVNWRAHARIVRRCSVLRGLEAAGARISALAYEAPVDLESIVEQAERELLSVTERGVPAAFVRMPEACARARARIEELASLGGALAGVPTGLSRLDAALGGLRGGDLVVIAARPGVGKTAFALNVAANAARSGAAVAFLSLEMPTGQLAERLVASESGVPLSRIRSGEVRPGDWARLSETFDALSGLDLRIDDAPGQTLPELRAKAHRELRDAAAGRRLVVVDYLQLVSPARGGRADGRAAEVAEVSRGLKALAKELDAPVLALSQLSRAVEARAHKRPVLSDLRESGAIEQDADVVVFLDRCMDAGEAEDARRPPMGCADLIVAKHRNGPTCEVRVAFEAETTSFRDLPGDGARARERASA